APGVHSPLAFAAMGAVAALVLVAALLFGWVEPPARGTVGVVGLLVLAAGLPARARHGGALDWLVPAALRAAAYLYAVAVGWAASVSTPVLFRLLFALALRHYDLTARMEKGAPAGRGTGALAGWDVRVLALAVSTVAGCATLAEAGLAAVVGGSFLGRAVVD